MKFYKTALDVTRELRRMLQGNCGGCYRRTNTQNYIWNRRCLLKMKDQLKVLEHKVETLQKTKDLPNSKNCNNEETTIERPTCRKCDDTFPSMKSLKRHVSSNHAPRIECKDCDKIFSKNYDLEVHIKN